MTLIELRQQKIFLIGLYKMYGDKSVRKEIRQLDTQIKRLLNGN